MQAKNEEQKTIACLSTKEIKEKAKPEFEADPDKFYPTQTLKKLGFNRSQCACGHYYWRHNYEKNNCGDSNCVGKYTFIGNGCGKGKRVSYSDAWKTFEKSLTSARIPCTSIDRYPVVARWRNDVDFTAAGIYCLQPYCVTGEMDPPANPLICPQFCVRFNDLDNIGLTGRHYSGFIMLGIQVFNMPDKFVFFKEECVEFNYRWLTEELGIEPDEITFIEDVWAGGGNLGPSIEYFVHGLEVGNMVFMQYKTFPDGRREELPVKIIDVGIGLERVSWLMNGTPTSYVDTFESSLKYLTEKLDIQINNDVWEKFGPYSCQLNVDESEDIEKTWKKISDTIGIDVETVKKAIAPVKDLYIILDHTRTVMMTIIDGSLPSNVGGGGNVRNVLRRAFAILTRNGWWDILKMEGFLGLFEKQKDDLAKIYGEFKEYKSFRNIIEVEYQRWLTTDDAQKKNLEKLLKNKKELTLDDWILAMTSWGIPADTISEISETPVPGNLYYEIALRADKITNAPEVILYDTTHLKETENLYYADHHKKAFKATITEVFSNIQQNNINNIVILDKSVFYPTSGGQQHDTGMLKIKGVDYDVVNVEKVGKSVLHILDKEVPGEKETIIGTEVEGMLDHTRRNQLRCHHTATHIVFAATRKVLGPHVWQNGAKKTLEQAHLDITHYKTISHDEEVAIENEANRIILGCHNITKSFMNKADAEKEHGFHLYQGGVVPGNSLRVVNIEGVDTEACCGTHCDNTSEVGWVKIIKTQRISDGIVRLYFVAYERTIELLNETNNILHTLCESWGVEQSKVIPTADRFFKEYKRLSTQTEKQELQILSLQIKCALSNDEGSVFYIKSDQESPTIYFTYLSQYAEKLKKSGKGIIFLGRNFTIGFLGNPKVLDFNKFEEELKKASKKPTATKKQEKATFKEKKKGAKAVETTEILQFNTTGDFNLEQTEELMKINKFVEL